MTVRLTRRAALGTIAGSIAAWHIRPAKAADTLRVGKSVVENIGFLPLDIGMQTGIFQKQGLTIEELVFAGGAKIAQAMTAGAVDVSLSAGPEMAFVAKGAPEIAVGTIAESPMFMCFCAPSNSSVRSIEDLKGKRIGITSAGSLTDWLVDKLNRHMGWSTDSDRATKVTIGGATPAVLAAFKTNEVDATITSLQGGYLFEEQQVGRMLFDCSKYIDALEFNTIFASTTLQQKNPDAIRRFLKGWYETIAYMKSHKDETVQIGTKVMGDPPGVVSKTYDALMGKFSTDGKFDPHALETLRTSFVELKTLQGTIDMRKLYTEQYLPKSSAT